MTDGEQLTQDVRYVTYWLCEYQLLAEDSTTLTMRHVPVCIISVMCCNRHAIYM